jgi:glutathione S-transferase
VVIVKQHLTWFLNVGFFRLFSWWCTLAFRPEGPRLGGGSNNPLKALLSGGGSNEDMSSSMKGFLDCIRKVDDELLKTNGPWFFGEQDYPTMIDFIFISHVERMLASLAFWKGLDLRDPKWKLNGLNRWLEAFEKRESYLAFKSDYYTHVKDIPPQYGPGYEGGFENDRRQMSSAILGSDGSWSLPLDHDDTVQPLYNGPPLPLSVLGSMDIKADADGSYKSTEPARMAVACRLMAGWKLASNGVNVASFASRGGPGGARNIRKTFGAELADPYASPDDEIKPTVDAALRVVCSALIDTDPSVSSGFPSAEYVTRLKAVVPKDRISGTISSLQYLRDRIGVPRDLPLAAARFLRAYLNWAIDELAR